MYFTGNLMIDPSEATKIKVQEPSGFLKKISYRVSKGKTGDKIESESFTALSVLKKLYDILKSCRITNLIKLTQDDDVIYNDKDDKHDDLDEVIMKYELEYDDFDLMEFQHLGMMLEHEEKNIHYLIKVNICKEHQVEAYPIEIKVKGLVDENELKQQYHGLKNSSSRLEEILRAKGDEFLHFLNQLDFSIRKYISVDDIKLDHDVNVMLESQDLKIFKIEGEHELSPESIAKIFNNIDFNMRDISPNNINVKKIVKKTNDGKTISYEIDAVGETTIYHTKIDDSPIDEGIIVNLLNDVIKKNR